MLFCKDMSNKNTPYNSLPFSAESYCTEFYTYSNINNLTEKCEISQNKVSRCRTVGILQSVNGKFYLVELDSVARKSSTQVRLSLIYLKSPLPSTVVPFPVQVFGFLQWKNRPVIYVTLLQVLNIPTALKLRNAMDKIANSHIATYTTEEEECELSDRS